MAPPKLLMTRPRRSSERTLAEVAAVLGYQPEAVISPLLRIEFLPFDSGGHHAGIILTSEHGAEALAATSLSRSLPVFAVGGRTAEIARVAGFEAYVGAGNADDLLAMILEKRPASPLLHLRGEFSRGNVSARLSAAGIETVGVVAYRQVAEPLGSAARALLSGSDPVLVPLFSPRTVSILAAQGPFAAPLTVLAISASVASAAQGVGARTTHIASRPDGTAMAALIARELGGGASA